MAGKMSGGIKCGNSKLKRRDYCRSMTKRQIVFSAAVSGLIMSLIISAVLVFLNVGAAGFMQAWPITWVRAFISAFICGLFVPRFTKWLMTKLKI